MLIYFVSGIILGAILVWLLYFTARREIVRIEEEKQLLQQEKHLVIEFMHHLVEAIGEGEEKEQLYKRIVHAAILSSGALSACLFERKEDVLKGVASEGLFPPQHPLPQAAEDDTATRTEFIEKILRSESFVLGEGLIGSVAQNQKAVLIRNAEKDPRVIKHADSALHINSIIVAPIIFDKTTLGVLAVANPADAMPFTENDLSLVESLAEQAGMAIHNSNIMKLLIEKNKLDFDISLASNIQGLLLPNVFPKSDILDFASYYKPAQKVGGDLYDVFTLPNKCIGIAIADVSGKGVPASILMAICQTNLRHFAKRMESPAEVLKAMNAAMQHEIRHDMFITMTYAIFNPATSSITLARAGHECPLLATRDNGNDTYIGKKICSEGMAIGMVPEELFNMTISDVTFNFTQDDILVLYTDGITESANAEDEEFGFSSLSSTVVNNRLSSSEKINQCIIESVEEFTESDKNLDDLTLVTLKHQ